MRKRASSPAQHAIVDISMHRDSPNQHPKSQTLSPILIHIYPQSIQRTTVQIGPNASIRSARSKSVVQLQLHGCACRVRHRNTTILYPVYRRESRSTISRYGFVFSFHRCGASLRSIFPNLHTTMTSRISDSWQRLTERGSQKLKSVAAKQGWRAEMGDQEEDYSSLPLTDRFVHKVGLASSTFGSVKAHWFTRRRSGKSASKHTKMQLRNSRRPLTNQIQHSSRSCKTRVYGRALLRTRTWRLNRRA